MVVDDDADASLCLRDILSQDGGYDCVGTCTSGNHALIDIPRINPDLVLMDVHLPDINGIECTRRLRKLMPFLKVIMVTGICDENAIIRSLQAGAIGYLVKPVTPDQCRATLKYAVAASEQCVSRPASATSSPAPYDSPLLTQRENLVMKCLAEGLLYKEIADRLNLSFSAVHKLQHKIYIKLKVANRTEAIPRWREGFQQL